MDCPHKIRFEKCNGTICVIEHTAINQSIQVDTQVAQFTALFRHVTFHRRKECKEYSMPTHASTQLRRHETILFANNMLIGNNHGDDNLFYCCY